jgi:spore maturation protein SpmB
MDDDQRSSSSTTASGLPKGPSRGFAARAARAAVGGARSSLKTVWFLLKVVVPVTLAVAILGWLGVLAWISGLLGPLMGVVGLPGQAALVLISSIFLNIYAAIAVAATMTLDLRSATILAIMCLTAHNMIVETAVMKKTGSSAIKMIALRVGMALAAGFALDLVLPAWMAQAPYSTGSVPGARPSFAGMIAAWAASTGLLSLKIVGIVLAVMIGQRLLEEFRVLDLLSRLLAPFMRVFGLPREASFLWIVINVVGYSYGAGVVLEQVGAGSLKKQDADLFNHHAGICHSLVEDSALYAAVGIPLLWITVPRLVLGALVVWLERARRHLVRRSFQAGTI